MPGVPLSSTSEPDALKNPPVLVTTYVYVTVVLTPLGTSVLSGVFVRLIDTLCPVTVAVSFAQTLPLPDVPQAVAMLVVVPERFFVEVQVALALGANGPHGQTVKSSAVLPGVPLSSTSVPEAGK